MTGAQIEGASVDGQYIHLDAEYHLNKLYGVGHIYVGWDVMHKAGLVDDHLNDNGNLW